MIGTFIAPVFAALVTILDKVSLSKFKADVKQYIIVLFFFLWFFTGLAMPFLGSVNHSRAFSLTGLGYFVLLIFFAFVWNSIYYRSQKHESMQEFEVIVMTLPLFTATLAAIIFPDERSLHRFIATIIAGLALVIAHWRRDHIVLNRYSWQLIVAVFFIAAETQVRKVLLDWYSPVALYFFRTGVLTILFTLIWRPTSISFNKLVWYVVVFSSLAGAAEMILIFYSYKAFGIVLTTLILMLGPILTYLLDFIILKEKLKPRIIVAALVILACIFYAALWG